MIYENDIYWALACTLIPLVIEVIYVMIKRHGAEWKLWYASIGHVNNVPTMQFFTGISKTTQFKSHMLSITECVWEFRNNVLWDAH